MKVSPGGRFADVAGTRQVASLPVPATLCSQLKGETVTALLLKSEGSAPPRPTWPNTVPTGVMVPNTT